MAKDGLSLVEIESMSARDAFGKTLAQVGEKNKNVVLLGADAIGSTRAAAFRNKFPDRTFNFGIAEQEMVSAAAGFALRGKIVVATAYGFLLSLRACEQVRTDIAYPNLNVKLMATHTGLSMSPAGTTHHSTEDVAIMRSFANMTVVAPSDALETAKAAEAVIESNGPVYMRMGRGSLASVHSQDYDFILGKGVEMAAGKDVTVIAYGVMVSEALQAAAGLAEDGLSVRVINMHTIKPLDAELVLKAAKETGCIVTAEEHTVIGGLGDAVSAVTSAAYPVPIIRIGLEDCFSAFGGEDEVRMCMGLTSDKIIEAVRLVQKMKS